MEEKVENEVKIKFRNSTYKVMWNCQQSGNFCMKKKDVTENFYFVQSLCTRNQRHRFLSRDSREQIVCPY
jgi:hypothetical protein